MNQNTKLIFALACFITALMMLAFIIGLFYGQGKLHFPDILGKTEKVSDCTNKTFIETTQCLNREFSSWFTYNLTQTGKNLSETDLKTSGGVCKHASEWYVQQITNLGFNGIKVTFYNDEITNGHAIALLYESDIDGIIHYCIVDQKSIIGCQEMEQSPKDLNTSINISIYGNYSRREGEKNYV